MEPKKILFIKLGSFSYINDQVYKYMELVFMEFKIDVIDVKQLLKTANFKSKMKLLVEVFRIYKIRRNLSLKKIKTNLSLTPFFWELTNKLIKSKIKGNEYIFSIQTQSSYNGKVADCPHYVYTDHTHLVNLNYPEFDKNKLNDDYWIEKERDLYKKAKGVFTMSNHVRDSLLNQYQCDPKKVHCVFAGASVFQEDITFGIERYKKKNILFVGVDWERKGGPELIEAFKLVLKKHPDAKLNIVGCFPKIDLPNVQVIGRVPIEEVVNYYKDASIFCMPSKREPFGIVYLEALAYKLPIIALDIGALPDFVSNSENGFLVKFNDIKDLADKLNFLLTNPELCQRMGGIGYEKVKTRYQWNISIENIKQVIFNDLGPSNIS